VYLNEHYRTSDTEDDWIGLLVIGVLFSKLLINRIEH
jgi:hypothetical protein